MTEGILRLFNAASRGFFIMLFEMLLKSVDVSGEGGRSREDCAGGNNKPRETA